MNTPGATREDALTVSTSSTRPADVPTHADVGGEPVQTGVQGEEEAGAPRGRVVRGHRRRRVVVPRVAREEPRRRYWQSEARQEARVPRPHCLAEGVQGESRREADAAKARGRPKQPTAGSPDVPEASPLSRGGLLSSGGSSSSRSVLSPVCAELPELDTRRRIARSARRARGAGDRARNHERSGMGYRDADVFSMGGATSSREFSTPHRKSRLGPAAPPPSIASVRFEERLDEDPYRG